MPPVPMVTNRCPAAVAAGEASMQLSAAPAAARAIRTARVSGLVVRMGKILLNDLMLWPERDSARPGGKPSVRDIAAKAYT